LTICFHSTKGKKLFLFFSIYHHTDHLSGSSVETDPTGYVLELQDYYPFGSIRVDDQFMSYRNKKKFTGKELDPENNLYYYGARYYDSDIGRFVSVDPAVLEVSDRHLENPQKLNWYSYVLNNPLKLLDPDGNEEQNFFQWLGSGIVEGAKQTIGVVAGLTYSVADNLTLGAVSHILPVEGNAGFQIGESIGNKVSIAVGAVETMGGITLGAGGGAGGLVLAPATGGISIVGGEAAIAGGTAVATHGVGVMMYAAGKDAGNLGNAQTEKSGNAKDANVSRELNGIGKAIQKHIDKVSNPAKYYPGWSLKNPSEQARTIKYWLTKDLPGLWKDFTNKLNKLK